MNRTTGVSIGAVAVIGLLIVFVATGLGSSSPSASPDAIGQGASPSTLASPSPTTSSAGSPTIAPSASPTPIPTPTPEPTPVLVPAPLTGRLVSPTVAARHPIAVMIDDLGAARPQSGLASAAVVWHAPAEAGIPRYMAIFQDTVPAAIGPVRSSRYYYIAWATEWRAIYAHAGGSPQAIETLRRKGNGQWVYNVDEFRYSGTFGRITTRYSPHNLYTTGKNLRRTGRNIGAKDKIMRSAWQFAPDAPIEERPYGGTITVGYPYNTVKYTYDRDTNTYKRSVTGEKRQKDASDGTRIAPKNVIVMRMAFGPLNDGHPEKHRLEADVIGSGPAWISTNGRTIKGTWKKAGIKKPTRFYDRQGNEIVLTVGQTFIQVLTTSSSGYPAVFKPGSDDPPG